MSLFTIGHSTHAQEYFLGLLRLHNIDYVLDVRSSPFSKFASQFNKDVIEEYLKKNNIVYCPMGKFFGARPTDRALYCAEGYLDFEKARASELFKKGLDNVMLGLVSVDEAMRNGSSLTMVKVDNLELYPKKKYQDDGYQAHYRAKFDYNGVHYEDISVTDPDYDAARTEYAGLVFGETYIIVSIGEEFNDRHYKIIAKIFELVYTIENNRFKLFHAFRDCQYLGKYSADIKYGLYDHLEETGERPCKKCKERLAEIYGE